MEIEHVGSAQCKFLSLSARSFKFVSPVVFNSNYKVGILHRKVNNKKHFLKPAFEEKGHLTFNCSQTKYLAKLLVTCSKSTSICSGMTCSERTPQERSMFSR